MTIRSCALDEMAETPADRVGAAFVRLAEEMKGTR